MDRVVLSNKPLVEAILELKWVLDEPSPGMKIDPHYKILVGMLFDKLRHQYPFHEPLPTSTMPDEIAGHVVQHRFRKGKDEWPLVQIGPGIITLNDTEGYVWEGYYKKAVELLDTFLKLYPTEGKRFKFEQIKLVYIDAIEFDFSKESILSFFKDKMKLNVSLHESLFKSGTITPTPESFDFRFGFISQKPKGAISMRFTRGNKKDKPAIIWETYVTSIKEDIPQNDKELIEWIEDAHKLTDDWFFKIIEGELYKRFK